MATTTPEQLQKISYAVHKAVMNKRKPIIADRKQMPWYQDFIARKKKTVGQAGGGTIIKMKKDGGLDLQFWERKDRLAFLEPSIEMEIEFPHTNVHVGMELVHEDLMKLGYSIEPNGARGKNFAKPMSEDEADRLINYFEEVVEEMMDTYDRKMDIALLRDGSYDSKAIVGLDGLISTTPTVGTFGTKSRANALLQNGVALGLTVSAAGTMRSGLTTLQRNLDLNSRGRGGQVDVIYAGAAFIDGYVAFALANNWQVQTNAAGTKRLDISVPDSGLHFNGIPIVHCPSFEIVDTLETAAVPWTKRAYLLTSKSWHLGMAGGLDKKFSAPLDPADQRVSKLSLDGRYSLICTLPTANGVASIA